MSEQEKCHSILARIFAFHDGELEESEAAEIREHLLGCEPCLGHFEVERAMRALIRRSCQEKAPESLLARIKGQFTPDFA
ncbi:MAG: mycothiol system anti-sigma-R factor [Propionibacteriaceae bacterium]|nr:mycothiol system anti-sigma-R factor [Propionibacteriaceae bacterium]